MAGGLNLEQKGVLISRIPLCGTTRIGGKHYNYTDYAHCTLCNCTRSNLTGIIKYFLRNRKRVFCAKGGINVLLKRNALKLRCLRL